MKAKDPAPSTKALATVAAAGALAVVQPDDARVAKRSAEIRAAADRCLITTDALFHTAGSFLLTIKRVRSEIADTFDEPIAAAYAAHKAIVAAKKRHSDPVDEAERIVKGKMADWRTKQEEEARERQRAAEAEARRVQEEQRKAAEAEAKRQAEIERKAEVARLKAEGATKAEVKEAAKAPLVIAPVVLPPPPPVVVPYVPPTQAAGISFREKWTATVIDLAALVRAVAEGKAPLALLAPDTAMLARHATAYHDKSPIPGVTFSCEKVVAAR